MYGHVTASRAQNKQNVSPAQGTPRCLAGGRKSYFLWAVQWVPRPWQGWWVLLPNPSGGSWGEVLSSLAGWGMQSQNRLGMVTFPSQSARRDRT